ncbi:hypothetical protein [Flavobacterium sp. UBA7682]|uniref:hypothetical protein n=1 Tax=Flavobacterium sp. UBA7682 TaxID=1946560 RepID=UPI0025B89087|nr:hypothetical protein [Flavobacterium sp. UBA7682]
MKFFYLCIFVFPFFISCSDNIDMQSQSDAAYHKVDTVIDPIPVNKDNPYDTAGQTHHQLLTSYYDNISLPLTLTGIISSAESIANENPSFVSMTNGVTFKFIYSDRVAAIVSDSGYLLDDTINNSLETIEAKNSLKSFINSLLAKCEYEDDYAVLHNYIVAYEYSVVNQANFTQKDKQVILTTSSIARHSVYARKKKPKRNTDPDWPLLIGNISGAIDGADDRMEDAVMMALITGIVDNK